jgi:hypothetical protein
VTVTATPIFPQTPNAGALEQAPLNGDDEYQSVRGF